MLGFMIGNLNPKLSRGFEAIAILTVSSNGILHVFSLTKLLTMSIFPTTNEEHLNRLEAVFKRHHDNSLKLKRSRCECFKSQITCLEHVVSDAGIQTNHESFQPRKYKPVPKNISEFHIVRSPSCEEIRAICKITLRSYCLPLYNHQQ